MHTKVVQNVMLKYVRNTMKSISWEKQM